MNLNNMAITTVHKNKTKTKKMFPEAQISHIFLNDKHLRQIPAKIEPEKSFVLFLHSNLITKIDNLSHLINLTHLYLQWNSIKKIENLNTLKNLKKLYLGNNQISVVENLECLVNLKELHIEKQILDCGETLCFDPRSISTLSNNLEVLNISHNRLTNIESIDDLKSLSCLIGRSNKIENCEKILNNLKKLSNLREIDFIGNPMCSIHRYKEKIIATCPKLEIMDKKPVPNQSRYLFKCFLNKPKICNEKENRIQNKKPAVNKEDEASNHSPDMLLALLEAQRSAALLARQKKIKDSSKGVVPRCFWRNKTAKTIDVHEEKNSYPFNSFLQSTEKH